MASLLNDWPILTATVRIPRTGNWSVEGDAKGDDPATGAGSLDFEGQTMVGTINRASQKGEGRIAFSMIGGAGGLETQVEARQYASGPKVSRVLVDICSKAGETVSSDILDSVLDRQLTSWQRAAGTAKQAIAALAAELEMSWRVLLDGTIWIGAETWTTVDPDVRILDDDQATGTLTTSLLPDLVPGVTFRDQQIELVTHTIGPDRGRTEASSTSPAQLLAGALGPLDQKIDFSRSYRAKVTKQNSDGTLQVLPENPKFKGSGLDKVKIELGVPGTVTVPAGAYVRLEFDGGNAQKPIATAFGDGSLTELKLGAGSDFVALAEKVLTELQAFKTWGDGINTYLASHIHSGVTTGGGVSGIPGSPPPGGPSAPSSVAASKVKAE